MTTKEVEYNFKEIRDLFKETGARFKDTDNKIKNYLIFLLDSGEN